jgi:hypothetical protein
MASISSASPTGRNGLPLFLRHRTGNIVEVIGGLEFKVAENIVLRPTARWSRTYSNVDLYDLDRTVDQSLCAGSFALSA